MINIFMTKHIKFGNILNIDRGIIVHGCNARGVMGSGLAAQIKAAWPACYELYTSSLKEIITIDPHEALGNVFYYRVSSDIIIANAITQANFGRDPNVRYVNYKAVQDAFKDIVMKAHLAQLPVHYPQIGAGLAHGDWSIINDIIDGEFANFKIPGHTAQDHILWIYEQ